MSEAEEVGLVSGEGHDREDSHRGDEVVPVGEPDSPGSAEGAPNQPGAGAHPEPPAAVPGWTPQAPGYAQPSGPAQPAGSAHGYGPGLPYGYPPQPPSGYPPGYPGWPAGPHPPYNYPPQPPRRRRIWPYVLAAVLLPPLLFVGCTYVVLDRVTDSVSDSSGLSDDDEALPTTDPFADVSIKDCTAVDGRLHASFVVNNSTSGSRRYNVTIDFVGPDDEKIGDASGSVEALAPGATSQLVNVFSEELAPDIGYGCPIAQVDRF